MSRDKGNRAASWVAAYLRAWWPLAEKTPNGVRGPDIENTPGVAWEVKTGFPWRTEWVEQAKRNGDGLVSPVIYLPPGCGETSVADAYGIVPLHVLMQLLTEAGYTGSGEPAAIADARATREHMRRWAEGSDTHQGESKEESVG